MDNNDPFYAWQNYVVKHSQHAVIQKLDDLINDTGGIFKDDPVYAEFRSLSLQFRITLLMEWGRYAEALAWLCLQTELNPHNLEAQALKEQLKKQLSFVSDGNNVMVNNNIKGKQIIFDWGKVAGMRTIKAKIERDILLPLKNREMYEKNNVSIPRGLLVYGPPGCGKTFIVKRIAELLKFHFFEVSPSSIASTYVHGTQQKIKTLFDEAKAKRPSLLFIDELEAFVPNRNRSDINFHYQAEVNEFLLQLNNAHQNGIFVVGATNYLNLIDDAIKRPGRFDMKLFFGPPDIEARIEAFKSLLKKRNHSITTWLYLGEETDNFTFAEINFVVEQTAREVSHQGKNLIDLNDLMKVIIANPPEFTDMKLQSYKL